MDDYFRVAMGIKSMAALDQVFAQFGKVVDFPVEDDPNRPIFIKNWLVTARKVDDAKSPHPQPRTVLDEKTFVIRAPMHDCLAHAVNYPGIDLVAGDRTHYARYSTHTLFLFDSRKKLRSWPHTSSYTWARRPWYDADRRQTPIRLIIGPG
jgi:hypothetical protein